MLTRLHVLQGMSSCWWCGDGGCAGTSTSNTIFVFKAAAWYGHFVDVVWLWFFVYCL